MSLIDEALKRARLEAAQRAAEREGLPYPTIPRHLAPPRRRRWLAPSAVALAVIGGVVVGLLVASGVGTQPERVAAAGVGAEPVTSGPATTAEVERDPPPDAPDPAGPDGDAPSGPPVSEPALSEPDILEPASSEPTPREEPPAAEPVTSGPGTPAELVRDPVAPETPGTPHDESAAAPRRTGRRPEAPPPAETPTGDDDVPQSPPAPSAQTSAPPVPAAEPTTPAVRSPAPPAIEAAPAPPARAATPPPEPPPKASTVTDPDSGVLLVLPGRPEPQARAGGTEPEPATPIESHVQRFPLPDGGAIELGGIAWSETGPFALINGRVVGPGSAIGDYTLKAIQQGHVELVGDGRRVLLSLQ